MIEHGGRRQQENFTRRLLGNVIEDRTGVDTFLVVFDVVNFINDDHTIFKQLMRMFFMRVDHTGELQVTHVFVILSKQHVYFFH